MQDGSEKLTIAQFAARAGCTTQRIYQLLQSTLQPFVICENGRKYILSEGLQAIIDAREKKGLAKHLPSDLPSDLPTLAKDLPTIAGALDALREQIDRQAAELDTVRAELNRARSDLTEAQQRAAVTTAERDAAQQRADLAEERERTAAAAHAAQLTAKDEQLAALAAALQTSQQAQTELAAALNRAQVLHAGTIRGQLETAADAEHTGQAEPEPAAEQTADGQTDGKRRGFFARLFRRKDD